jgi:hypothetical protein
MLTDLLRPSSAAYQCGTARSRRPRPDDAVAEARDQEERTARLFLTRIRVSALVFDSLRSSCIVSRVIVLRFGG